MEIAIAGLLFSALLSFSLVAYCSYLYRKTITLSKKNDSLTMALADAKKAREMAYDAQALLTDLLNGVGMVRVERLSPLDYFLKSPKA